MAVIDQLTSFLPHLADGAIFSALAHLQRVKGEINGFSGVWVCICAKCCFKTQGRNNKEGFWWGVALAEKGLLLKKWSRFYHSNRGLATETAVFFPNTCCYLAAADVYLCLKAERDRRARLVSVNVQERDMDLDRREDPRSDQPAMTSDVTTRHQNEACEEGAEPYIEQGFDMQCWDPYFDEDGIIPIPTTSQELEAGLPRNDGSEVIPLGCVSTIPTEHRRGVMQVSICCM